MQEDQGSVTTWIDALQNGDFDAAELLYQRYMKALVRVAKSKMVKPLALVDEEDVASDVFYLICEGARRGKFSLSNRHDFWSLLIKIAHNKVIDAQRFEGRQRRDAERTVIPDRLAELGIANQPTVESMVVMQEQLDRLLQQLKTEQAKKVLLLRLKGQSNREIADLVGISERSVERKFRMVRKLWKCNSTE